jgi:hypothetical protein
VRNETFPTPERQPMPNIVIRHDARERFVDVVRASNMDLVISPHSADEFRDFANERVREPTEQLEGLEGASSTSSVKSLASTSNFSYSPESGPERAMEPDDNDGDKRREKDESDRNVKSEGKRVRFEAMFQDVNRTVEVTHSESESEDENKRTSRDNTMQSTTLEYDTFEVENPKEKSKELREDCLSIHLRNQLLAKGAVETPIPNQCGNPIQQRNVKFIRRRKRQGLNCTA